MAGKTLTGIGEDDSGGHELGVDLSVGAVPSVAVVGPDEVPDQAEATPSAHEASHEADRSQPRATDRMPLFASPNGGPVVRDQVDEDKVAEGLKKLRSLDEPLGPIPSSMPTLKEGIPVVSGPPTPINPATIAAAAAAELLRSRGTAHGHALSVAAGGQNIIPVSIDDRMKGTLLGHSLHLPDLPEPSDDNKRQAEIRSIARVAMTPEPVVIQPTSEFSHGDSHFFDTDPVASDYEPESPRGKMMARSTIFVAVVSVFVVAAIAWVRVHKSDPPPADVSVAPPQVPAINALDNPSVPSSAPATPPPSAAPAPSEPAAAPAPTPAPPVAAAPAVTPPPSARVAAAPEDPFNKPSAEVVAPAERPAPAAPHTHPKHHEPSEPSGAKPSASATPHSTNRSVGAATRPAGSTHEPVPGKRGKDEDPDGTLPLTD